MQWDKDPLTTTANAMEEVNPYLVLEQVLSQDPPCLQLTLNPQAQE